MVCMPSCTTPMFSKMPVTSQLTQPATLAICQASGSAVATTPALTARATQDGRRVTVAGHASDEAGVTSVTVGGRMARIADDGAYSVSYTAPVGTESVTVTATSGVGATGTEQVSVTRSRSGRGAAPAAGSSAASSPRAAAPPSSGKG